MGGSDEYLYSPDVLIDLNLDNSSAKFNPSVSMLNPGEGLKVRPLAKEVCNKQVQSYSRISGRPPSLGLRGL